MDNKKKYIYIGCILGIILIIAVSIVVYYLNNKSTETTTDNKEIVKESTSINVEYSNSNITENYNAKITLSDTDVKIDGTGVTCNNGEITITAAGTYYITGTLKDGNIKIEATKNDDVVLVLDNAQITSSKTAVINCVKANKLTINLASNSKNILTDASTYTVYTDTENEEPDATIFSKSDLVIDGDGSLTVNANYKDGIASKDGLIIANSNITINSKDDGIRGKDYVYLKEATLNITAGGDGIKSTNDTDENLGYIKIEGGSITIKADSDGIQAEKILNIKEAEINITTQGIIAAKTQEQNFGFNKTQTTTTSSDSTSSKALKAGTEITIESGNIKINSTDDAIHSNGILIINGGNIDINAGDDGIHADTNIVINNGTINISKSYEGIESNYIEINGGTINLVASDDGINVSGGNDSSSMGMFSQVADTNRKLVINGGDITVNSTGDGLDANGSIEITGGKILVIGPTSGGNGPLDYDSGFTVTGGELIVYGSTGMWQNPSNTSTQNSISFNKTGNSGDKIVLKDSNGNEIVSFTAEKTYGAVLISSSKITNGETYTLWVNGTNGGELTVNSTVTTNISGTQGMGGQMGGMQKQGGMQMQQGTQQTGEMPQGTMPQGQMMNQGMQKQK